jgi:Arc/MetJ-type ribon-helix-helix transcriptional regulator
MPKRNQKMSELVGVRFTAEKLDEIEEWRREQPGKIPNRTDAIRALIDEGLASYKRRAAEKPGKGRKG